jgi:hypothetical protein
MTKEIQAILDAVGVAIEDPEVHCVVVNRPPDRAPLLAIFSPKHDRLEAVRPLPPRERSSIVAQFGGGRFTGEGLRTALQVVLQEVESFAECPAVFLDPLEIMFPEESRS